MKTRKWGMCCESVPTVDPETGKCQNGCGALKPQHTPTPFISMYRHEHGISVAVNQTGQSDGDFWAMDGYNPKSSEAENEWFERYELPEDILRKVDTHSELLLLLKDLRAFCGYDVKNSPLLKRIDTAIAKAEGK